MNCQQVSSLLSSYLDEMLPAREAGAVAGHLTRCAACRRELDALEKAIAALDRVPPVSPPIDLWNRFQQRLVARPAVPLTGGERSATGAARGRWASGAGRRVPIGWRELAMAATVLMAVATGGFGYRIALEDGDARQSVLAGALIARHDAGAQAAERISFAQRHSSRAATRKPLAPASILAPELVIRSFESDGAVERESAAERPGHAGHRSSAPSRRTTARVSEALRGSDGSSAADGQERGTYAAKPGFGLAPGAPEGSIPRLPLDEWAAENLGASAPVADALQAGIEETARQQVAEEVALLAQALTRAEAHRESAQ